MEVSSNGSNLCRWCFFTFLVVVLGKITITILGSRPTFREHQREKNWKESPCSLKNLSRYLSLDSFSCSNCQALPKYSFNIFKNKAYHWIIPSSFRLFHAHFYWFFYYTWYISIRLVCSFDSLIVNCLIIVSSKRKKSVHAFVCAVSSYTWSRTKLTTRSLQKLGLWLI